MECKIQVFLNFLVPVVFRRSRKQCLPTVCLLLRLGFHQRFIDALVTNEIGHIKTILSYFELLDFMLKICLLALQSLLREAKRLNDIFYVLLAHLRHVYHPIQKCVDSFLILFEDVCHFDHVVALIKTRVVENKAKEVDKLLAAFGILETVGLELNLHNLADIVSNSSLSSQLICVLIDTLLKVIQLPIDIFSQSRNQLSYLHMMFLNLLKVLGRADHPDIPRVIINKLINADNPMVLMRIAEANGTTEWIIPAKRIQADYVKRLFRMQASLVAEESGVGLRQIVDYFCHLQQILLVYIKIIGIITHFVSSFNRPWNSYSLQPFRTSLKMLYNTISVFWLLQLNQRMSFLPIATQNWQCFAMISNLPCRSFSLPLRPQTIMPFLSSPSAPLAEYPGLRQESLAPMYLLYSLTLAQTMSPGLRLGLLRLVTPSNQRAPSMPSSGALISTMKLSLVLFLMIPITNWLTSGMQVVTFLMISMHWWPLLFYSNRQPKYSDFRVESSWKKLVGLQRLYSALTSSPGKTNLSLLFDYKSI